MRTTPTTLTSLLPQLIQGHSLSEDDMSAAIGTMMDGHATPVQMAAFLIALRVKGETVDELTGAARAMRARMTPIVVHRAPILDTCGTGGDGAGTFNISTAVAFVAAANGIAVAKHGNRAVSSRSGSADLLAALGVNIAASRHTVEACIRDINLGFLFAPACHPAMKHAASVRQELGVRTVFNLLGPLTNPANADRQLLGVFDRALVRPIAETLGRLGSQRAWVVHGADGLDELTVCDSSDVAEWHGGRVITHTIQPEDVGLARHHPSALLGGSPEDNAQMLRVLLAGGGPQALIDAVALNAGAALMVCDVTRDLATGVARAQHTLRSGHALTILDALIARSQRDA